MKNSDKKLIILFWGNSIESENKDKNLSYFNSLLITEPKKRFIIIDLGVNPDIQMKEHIEPGFRICEWKNGRYINQDLLKD